MRHRTQPVCHVIHAPGYMTEPHAWQPLHQLLYLSIGQEQLWPTGPSHSSTEVDYKFRIACNLQLARPHASCPDHILQEGHQSSHLRGVIGPLLRSKPQCLCLGQPPLAIPNHKTTRSKLRLGATIKVCACTAAIHDPRFGVLRPSQDHLPVRDYGTLQRLASDFVLGHIQRVQDKR